MRASLGVLLHSLKVRSDKSTECLKVMSSYSLRLASGGGVPPIKPTAFVYQMVIFSIEAPPDVI